MRSRSPIAWAALDLAACLILVIYTLIAPVHKKHHRPTISTLGLYAITATWPKGSNDDVDLYVRDPKGNIVFFSASSQGQMQLEHDDRGCSSGSGYGTHNCVNYERVVLRGFDPGEYTVNVEMFAKNDSGVTPVTVRLYRLAGHDTVLKTVTVKLQRLGSERTAFRFEMNAQGVVTGYNDLQRPLTGESGSSLTAVAPTFP